MRKTHSLILFFICLLSHLAINAQEGMWIPPYFPADLADELDEAGSDLMVDDIYQDEKPSLKDPIVYLSNGYSGVLLSEEGLLLTNYRPFASYIHSLDSLDQEFYAKDTPDETPISHLSAYLLKSSQNIDGWILSRLRPYKNEADKKHQIDSVCYLISKEQILPQGTVAKVQATVNGNYYLNFYQKYDDLRMVYAPAKAKAQWAQPSFLPNRHQADFSLLRIYVSRDNMASAYSEFNCPIKGSPYVKIAKQPYKEGDYVFAMGYPNASERLVPAAKLQEELYKDSLTLQVHAKVQALLGKRPFLNADSVYQIHERILSQGILVQKQARETAFTTWAANQTDFQKVLRYSNLIPLINKKYQERHPLLEQYLLNQQLFAESKIVQMGYLLLDMNAHNERETLQLLSKYYEHFNAEEERLQLQTLLQAYEKLCDPAHRPLSYSVINVQYKGKIEKYLKTIFKKSFLTEEQKFVLYLDNPTKEQRNQDPLLQLCADLKATELELYREYNSSNPEIIQLIQIYHEGLLVHNPLYQERTDANYTLRFDWGQIKGYSPYEGWEIPAIGHLKGLENSSFLHPYSYPDTAEEKAEIAQNDSIHTDFLTTLDFPNGRMGEAVFNLNGELLGLLYDVNPEAQDNTYYYNATYHRTIAGDIHYLLYLLEKAQANRLLEEMEFGELEQTVDIEYVQPTLNLFPVEPDSIFRLPVDTVVTINNQQAQWLGNDSVQWIKDKSITYFPIDSLIQFIPDSLRFWVKNPLKQTPIE